MRITYHGITYRVDNEWELALFCAVFAKYGEAQLRRWRIF